MTKAERRRRYEALTKPTKAADYGTSMPAKDFLAESKVRGDEHPWLPTEADLEATRKHLAAAKAIGESVRAGRDDLIMSILMQCGEGTNPTRR